MGANFGAQAFGVTPDIMTTAKAITNGAQPMGAVAACAAGLALMNIIRDEKLIERAAATGPVLADAKHSLAGAPGRVGVRSIGMMAGVDLEAEGGAGARAQCAPRDLGAWVSQVASPASGLVVIQHALRQRRQRGEHLSERLTGLARLN